MARRLDKLTARPNTEGRESRQESCSAGEISGLFGVAITGDFSPFDSLEQDHEGRNQDRPDQEGVEQDA